jgi:hypothetical protein
MATKGMVSDAFKRAGSLKWGVARNVYLLPSLWAICRTYDRQGKKTAAPSDDAPKELVKQLTTMGWDVSGVRLHDEDAGGEE